MKFPNAQVLERVYYFEGCCLLGVVPGQVLSGDGPSVVYMWLGCLEVCCSRELKIMILVFSKLISTLLFSHHD